MKFKYDVIFVVLMGVFGLIVAVICDLASNRFNIIDYSICFSICAIFGIIAIITNNICHKK